MSDRFALQIQTLKFAQDRVLFIADLVSRRSEDGKFVVADLNAAFYELNVPPPRNVSVSLGNLRDRSKVIRHPDGRWTLTPLGQEALTALAIDVAGEANLASDELPGAQFAHTDHTVIPSWAAPPRWATGIARLLERHPFDTNALCMTRFPSEGAIADPVAEAIDLSRSILNNYGMTLHLASDAIVDEDLLGNVGAYMWACRYGLGIVENREGRGLNYNAVIELGGMALTGRRCMILKDVTSPSLPTDLSGQIYKSVDLEDRATVSAATEGWVKSDLGMRCRL